MARSKESELSKKLKAAHLLAVKDYWSFRPRAKTGIEYTRKQYQFQDDFYKAAEVEDKKVIFLGSQKWSLNRLNPDEVSIWVKDGEILLINMDMPFRQAKLNGTLDVDPKILHRVYEMTRDLLVDYYKTSTKRQPMFGLLRGFLIPLSWVIPGEKGSELIELAMAGNELWLRKGLSDNAYGVTSWSRGDTDDKPIRVILRADFVNPHMLLHEFTHVIQRIRRTRSKFSGFPFKTSKYPEIGAEDGNTGHHEPIEFFTYSKDKALEVVNVTVNLYDRAAKWGRMGKLLESLRKSLPKDEFYNRWDIMFGLFRDNFSRLVDNYVLTVGFDEATKRKFIAVTYDSAYKQLVLYAKQNRVPGAPNA